LLVAECIAFWVLYHLSYAYFPQFGRDSYSSSTPHLIVGPIFGFFDYENENDDEDDWNKLVTCNPQRAFVYLHFAGDGESNACPQRWAYKSFRPFSDNLFHSLLHDSLSMFLKTSSHWAWVLSMGLMGLAEPPSQWQVRQFLRKRYFPLRALP